MIGLYQMGLDLLEECGIGKEEGEELFQPLVEKNVHQMLWEGAVEALTGPGRCWDSSKASVGAWRIGRTDLPAAGAKGAGSGRRKKS